MLTDNRKLLVVDDEPIIGKAICDIAAENGYQTMAARNFDEFVHHYTSDTDIFVLDLFLPDRDGVELIRFLSHNCSSSALILMTGRDKGVLNSARELAIQHGLLVLGTLTKPFRKSDFEELLSKDLRSPASDSSVGSDLPSTDEIRSAVANNDLSLAFQPKISASSRAVVGAEVLARWQHPTKGMIPPSYFVTVAERNGFVDQLTDFVLDQALRQSHVWLARGIRVPLAINMSPQSLSDLAIPEKISTRIKHYGLEPSHLSIEVTETVIANDLTNYIDILTRLRMKGFNLSIDDFGTGYSSLRQLVQVPFSELKLDQTFIRHIDTDPESRSIAKVSIALAHELGMMTVAEGVETEDEWRVLNELGCDRIQGYFVGRPMANHSLMTWLRDWEGSATAA